jgi:hypothetical protein
MAKSHRSESEDKVRSGIEDEEVEEEVPEVVKDASDIAWWPGG